LGRKSKDQCEAVRTRTKNLSNQDAKNERKEDEKRSHFSKRGGRKTIVTLSKKRGPARQPKGDTRKNFEGKIQRSERGMDHAVFIFFV